MPWISINSRSGVSGEFKRLPTPDQRRMLPSGSLPFNLVDIDNLDRVLNGIPEIFPEYKNKKTLLVEGYYPPKFGVWSAHKLYRIKFRADGTEKYVVAKKMPKVYGEKEFSILFRLSNLLSVPKPFHFLYDCELESDGFPDVQGILWMTYIEHRFNFNEYILKWCIEESEISYFEKMHGLLTSIWSLGIKHNDLKGEHLLLGGDGWSIIDFEKSKVGAAPIGEKDMDDEISVLLGDFTVYMDRFIFYHGIKFSGDVKSRYEKFISEFLNCFGIEVLESRYLPLFMRTVKNEELRASIEKIEKR